MYRGDDVKSDIYSKYFNNEEYENIVQRTEMSICEHNKKEFKVEEEVKIDIDFKNTKSINLSIYEIESENYYLTKKEPINSLINIEGIIASQTADIKIEGGENPLKLIRQTINISQIPNNKPGIYLVEILGKGISYEELKICKSLNSEDLKNCLKMDLDKGTCQQCKDGYYLSNDDRKCNQTQYCYESTFGICRKCTTGYYLDKKQQKCLRQEGAFEHCRESLDGRTCDVCDEDYYFDDEGICCGTNYCAVRGEYYRCKKCKSGYYLSSYGDCCTPDKNCYYGNRY